MPERPEMYDWSDACEYMEELEAEIERLRAAIQRTVEALGLRPTSDTSEPR